MTNKELTHYRTSCDIVKRSLTRHRQRIRKEGFKLSSTAAAALIRPYFSQQTRDELDLKGGSFIWLVLFSPLVFTLSALLLVLIPFNYYEHLKTKRAELNAIDVIIAKLADSTAPAYQPEARTIEGLWRAWFAPIIKASDLDSDTLIELLIEWVRVSYGDKSAKGLDIQTAYQSIRRNSGHTFRNLGTAARPEFLHINHSHPNDALISYVSNRLPRYKFD